MVSTRGGDLSGSWINKLLQMSSVVSMGGLRLTTIQVNSLQAEQRRGFSAGVLHDDDDSQVLVYFPQHTDSILLNVESKSKYNKLNNFCDTNVLIYKTDTQT